MLYKIIKNNYFKIVSQYIYRNLENSRFFFKKGKNWYNATSKVKQIAVLWGFSKWKWNTIARYLPEYRVLMASNKGNWADKKKLLDRSKNLIFIVWGYQCPPEVIQYAKERGFSLFIMEDGFIRSAELGCKHTEAQSLILDSKGIYFDATKASDLEYILNTYQFLQYPALLDISKKLITVMKALRVSKYNPNLGIANNFNILPRLGPKKRYRILVVGQLESDASLTYGLASDWTNLKLLQTAHEDYPEAEIIYRPHPDTLYLERIDSMGRGNTKNRFYTIVSEDLLLADLFKEVDHVYTITSLSGFEALLHGLPVTVMGMPFYSGWGLTEDRQQCSRRTRSLSIEELFCGAYLLYPRYIANLESPILGCLETMIKVISPQIEDLQSKIQNNI